MRHRLNRGGNRQANNAVSIRGASLEVARIGVSRRCRDPQQP